MKLSLTLNLALVALVGCGSSTEQPPAPAPIEAPPADAPAPAKVRTLLDGTVQPTSPVNLLADPGFALVGQGANYTSFLAFEEESSSPYDLETGVESRAPSGFGGSVALVRTSGATDTSSSAVVMLASVPGGQGPFRAQIWFSKSDARGRPTALVTDGSAAAASVTEESPDGKAYDLSPVPEAARVVSGRTWVLYRAEIPGALPYGGFLVVRTGSAGGQVQIAAPEVTSAEIVVGAPILAARTSAPARSRALTAYERAALRRFRGIRPRLVPAGFRSR
jgi:hypothetical protein